MELEQLQQFLVVAEVGNFTHAADKLAISQSALSRSIQRLEDEFGVPLFERQPRQLQLTDAGMMLQPRANHLLQVMSDLKAEIADDGETGCVRVGAIPTIAPFFLPGILKSFAAQFPKANVVITEDTTDNLVALSKQGELDIAIMAAPVEAKYLDVQELFVEELLLVMPFEHQLAASSKIRIEDVEPFPFVLLGEAHCLSDQITTFCRQKSFSPVSVERTNQLATVLELVALDHGVSLIPEMARKLDSSPKREYRSLHGLTPRRTIVAVWNPYRFQSRLLKSFRSLLCEETAAIVTVTN